MRNWKLPSSERCISFSLLLSYNHSGLSRFISLFVQHNMEEYRQSLLRGFLEKTLPKYSLPGPAGSVKEVGFLKPNVNTVEVHKYPDEVAAVLEGDNLWFCHQIRLGDYIPPIPKLEEHIAHRSIQFNFCLSKHTAKIVNEDGYVKVTLYSHFAHPIRKKVKAELVSCFIVGCMISEAYELIGYW